MKFKGVVYGIISSATFGMIPLFAIPVMQSGMAIESILFYRFALSALIMGILAAMQNRSFKVSVKELGTLMVLGLTYASTANLLMNSYEYISSGMATTIHFLYPVLVTLIMFLFFKEKSSVWVFIGILMALAGVALMCMGEGFGTVSSKGLLFAFSTIVTYALFIVGVNSSCVKSMDSHILTFYVLMFGSFLFLGTGVASHGIIELPYSISDAVNLVLLALIPTMISDLTLVLAIKNVGSTVTSVLGSMEPLTAVLLGVLVFHENFTVNHFFGIVLVVTAVSMVIIAKKRFSR